VQEQERQGKKELHQEGDEEMTLLLRWDAADTMYLSGLAGERYVHFPVEISATIPTTATLSVQALDASGAVIVEQSYPGFSLTPDEWIKVSPAILVPDSYFAESQNWMLKVLRYTVTVPVTTPRLITKTISNTGRPAVPTWAWVVLAGSAFILLGGKKFLK